MFSRARPPVVSECTAGARLGFGILSRDRQGAVFSRPERTTPDNDLALARKRKKELEQ